MTILLRLVLAFLFFSQHAFASKEVTWNQLKELDGNKASAELTKSIEGVSKVRGFMMPLDFSSKKITEYLLMPYVPACIHVPPPSANQVILVKMEKGKEIEPSFYPVEVTGKIIIKESKEFESSFEMTGTDLKEIQQ